MKLNEDFKRGIIGKEAYEDIKTTKLAAARLGPELMKHFTELQKERNLLKREQIQAGAKQPQQPSEAVIKQANAQKALSSPTGLVISHMIPGVALMGTNTKALEKYDEAFNTFDPIIQKIKAWDRKSKLWTDANEKLLADQFYTNQKKTLQSVGYPKTTAFISQLPRVEDSMIVIDRTLEALLSSKDKPSDDELLQTLKSKLQGAK